MAPGLVAVMILVPSMTADVCDVDERATGWDTKVGAAQSAQTYLAMRVVFSSGTVLLAIVAAVIMLGHSVTPEMIKSRNARR